MTIDLLVEIIDFVERLVERINAAFLQKIREFRDFGAKLEDTIRGRFVHGVNYKALKKFPFNRRSKYLKSTRYHHYYGNCIKVS